ncbi:MAG TPA: cupin domain-containing protein [Solirubrobacterales bacterium]|nr:cupin domain-containing protein [Solirubrobacterales bacterium]
MWSVIEEARLRREEGGLVPDGPGWFVLNVADARGSESESFGASVRFMGEGDARFPEFAINVRVLQPGQPNSLYHRESNQEAFLVLSGECLLIVEGEERALRKGDFVHFPPGAAHVALGAGERPSSILMVGTVDPDEEILYPRDEAAVRHGAAASEETPDPAVAYAGHPKPVPGSIGLPW